jgi:hypothetical protein
MKFKLVLLLIAASSIGAAAQTVTVTPRKVMYKRPRPQDDSKKEFTITYPKVKAATPSLSAKIERSISYQSVIDLRLKDEMNEFQWLESADFEVKYNKNGILCVEDSMEGTAAYPSDVSKIVCVDTRTGVRARPADVFTNIVGLTAMVRKAQESEKRKAIPQIKKDNPDVEEPEQLFGDKRLTAKDLDGYEVSDKGVTFHYDYEFPHVAQGLQPDGNFFYTWSQLRPYIKKGGLLTRVAR